MKGISDIPRIAPERQHLYRCYNYWFTGEGFTCNAYVNFNATSVKNATKLFLLFCSDRGYRSVQVLHSYESILVNDLDNEFFLK